jgi:hypothetical protein
MTSNSNLPKKDLFSTNSIAANFFLEKFEKLRKQANTPTPPPQPTTTPSIGLSYHKKINKDDDLNSISSNDDCVVVSVTNCKFILVSR